MREKEVWSPPAVLMRRQSAICIGSLFPHLKHLLSNLKAKYFLPYPPLLKLSSPALPLWLNMGVIVVSASCVKQNYLLYLVLQDTFSRPQTDLCISFSHPNFKPPKAEPGLLSEWEPSGPNKLIQYLNVVLNAQEGVTYIKGIWCSLYSVFPHQIVANIAVAVAQQPGTRNQHTNHPNTD